MPLPPSLPANTPLHSPGRDPAEMLAATLSQWRGRGDLWIFGYASLIWRPEFSFAEERIATAHGYHRALKMWSRINRGTPECPGLVFGLLRGGSCKGVAFRIPEAEVEGVFPALWAREMVTSVYDPRWVRCRTSAGEIEALAFTLARSSPNYTGVLSDAEYRQIFTQSCGRFGTTRDYAQLTYDKLLMLGIHDRALGQLLQLAGERP